METNSQTTAIKSRRLELIGIYWDLLIIFLVTVNLALILIDTLFAIEPLAAALKSTAPALHQWYLESVHQRFIQIDLMFVAIFLADVLIGWAVAIASRRYHRWFFYPFVHWYDVLGCIPVAGMRWLRVLRIFALLLRLQRVGWIDIRNWSTYQVGLKYYDILLEELSDRIVIKVLSGVQEEIRSGAGELPRRLASEVLRPRQEQLTQRLATSITNIVQGGYHENSGAIREFVAEIVRGSVQRNAATRGIEKFPVLGRRLVALIDDTIADTIGDAVDEVMSELGEDQFRALIDHITSNLFDRMEQPTAQSDDSIATGIVVDAMDLLKAQVARQRWKQRYD